MTNKYLFLVFLVLLVGIFAHGDQLGCQLTPAEINGQGTDTVKIYYDEKTDLDDAPTVHTKVRFHYGSQGLDKAYFNFEGYLRPRESATFVLFAPLKITAKVSRKNNMVYVCAHDDEERAKRHITVYFLYGYGLERSGIRTGIQNFFHPRSLKISPLRLSFLGLDQGVHDLTSFLNKIPLLNILTDLPVEILKGIQGGIEDALAALDGLGVERIVIRPDSIELATGIDVNNPNTAKIIKTIPINKPISL